MKKFFAIAIAMLTFSGAFAAEIVPSKRTNWGEKFALYLPNRILDILDIFSVTAGVGAVAEARLMGTRLANVGAGYSAGTYKLYKDYNRQYGIGVEDGWYWSFVSIGEEDYRLREGTLLVDKYGESLAGIPTPEMRVYDFYTGPRDYWAIGGSLGFIVDAGVYIHPVEWVDLALGFLMIDIREDDLSFDSFSR
ncbi:MAG: hypothetical protein E7058_04565 [Lentisphaerae bacterium]|nr:hypothetical protein [Lentisphaerota bacterium]